ncbi:MAG: hypothetical protein NDI75_13825 [Candidatus Didemnitutus sp.]|nr:hypothetical protein [Candidatus Didemnitutus sp.]
MKTLLLTITMLAMLSSATRGATDDTKSFVDHFHDDVNIPSYVALVDELIDAGEARIYTSVEEQKKDSRSPRAKTPNGILMLYTLTHTPGGVLVHFSTSRAPYLPTALGKHIVGLFMARSGWPKPAMFSVSDHQVFHAVWMVPEVQFVQIKAALPELREKTRKSEDAKAAFLRGLLRSRDLEEGPNQPPQRNAGSRPSSDDSPASETPSSLGPRG